MADAPTPLPHTPAIYLNAGGSAFFSANCQEALIRAGFDPDDFGSHEQQRARIHEAKRAVSNWANATPDQRAPMGPIQPPTPQQIHLADCTASHLIQDRVMRRADAPPGSRGDPCWNQVDGFLTGQAPAMPVQGRGQDADSMEGRNGVREQQDRQAMRDANQRNGRPLEEYPEANRHGHEDARVRGIVDDQSRLDPANNRHVRQGGALAGTTVGDQQAIARRGPTDGMAPGQPTVPEDLQIDGDTAADCINAWRRKAELAMKTSAVDAEIERLDQMANPRTAAERRAQRQARADAEAQRDAAAAASQAAQAQAQAINHQPGATPQQRAAAALRAEVAQGDLAGAQGRVDEFDTAQARLTCLQQQQRRIRAGTDQRTAVAVP